MSAPLKVVVIGAGIMGANHARVARSLRNARLVAVVDPDLERAAAAGGPGVQAVASLDEVVGGYDAAVVAVPTPQHAETAIALARNGVHLLVEKPIAATIEQAHEIVAAAAEAGVVLAVGHVERFNAAVAELPRLLDRPIHIEASRISPYSARVADGVILDLMIHDLDIVCSLAGNDAEPIHVAGVSRAVMGDTEDLASVTLEFSTGLTATFNTSRLGQQKIRTLEITQAESVIVADLVRQDITVHRMSRHEYLSDEGSRYRQSSVIEIPFLEARGEPLALELQHFVDCISTGATPRADGAAGVRALALAQFIAGEIHRGTNGVGVRATPVSG
jgi:predicted dehydrogenase